MTDYIQIGLLAIVVLLLLKEYARLGFNKTTVKNSVIVDTSVLIDGRVIEIARSGFMPGKLVIPQFVVNELQLIADSSDSHKRERARFGLDVLIQLQTELRELTTVINTDYNDLKMTDDKLVRLASETSSYLCTMDFNLNKVAAIKGVTVLNINQLAQAVRPVALPGERHTVKIVQKGSNKDQGVGYLEDGTMVVVSGAGNMIGKKLDITVTRMLQTEAGKMMFAKRAYSDKRAARK